MQFYVILIKTDRGVWLTYGFPAALSSASTGPAAPSSVLTMPSAEGLNICCIKSPKKFFFWMTCPFELTPLI